MSPRLRRYLQNGIYRDDAARIGTSACENNDGASPRVADKRDRIGSDLVQDGAKIGNVTIEMHGAAHSCRVPVAALIVSDDAILAVQALRQS